METKKEKAKSNVSALFKELISAKGMTQKVFAERLGITLNSVRNSLYSDNFQVGTFKLWADALGCDVVLIDRETGEIHNCSALDR